MQLSAQIAADFLRIDNPDASTLSEVESMLTGATAMIERSTGYLYGSRTKEYPVQPDGYFRIYDYPINTDLAGLTGTPEYQVKSNYTIISNPTGADSLELNVGQDDPSQYPDALGQAILQLVKHFYYESETQAVSGAIPTQVQGIINKYRRFIL